MEAFALTYMAEFTYVAIFGFLMLAVFGSPLPEDGVLLLSGVVVSRGIVNIFPVLTVSYVGVIIGDLLLYYIGRRLGYGITGKGWFSRVLTERRLERAGRWFDRWGNPLVFFGRHLVGLRAQIFLCAGVFRLPAKRVFLYDALSAAISVPLMVGLGYYFGHNYEALKAKVFAGHWAATIGILLLGAGWAVYRIYRKKANG